MFAPRVRRRDVAPRLHHRRTADLTARDHRARRSGDPRIDLGATRRRSSRRDGRRPIARHRLVELRDGSSRGDPSRLCVRVPREGCVRRVHRHQHRGGRRAAMAVAVGPVPGPRLRSPLQRAGPGRSFGARLGSDRGSALPRQRSSVLRAEQRLHRWRSEFRWFQPDHATDVRRVLRPRPFVGPASRSACGVFNEPCRGSVSLLGGAGRILPNPATRVDVADLGRG